MGSGLISVIVTTYNWPKALSFVLLSLFAQTDQNFEIVVADDGSRAETRQLIENLRKTSPVPLKHAWQEDKGFRLSRSRNNGIQKTSGEYVIFIDGDCCVRPDFIQTHRRTAAKGAFISGKRIYMRKWATEFAFRNDMHFSQWGTWRLFPVIALGAGSRPFLLIDFGQSEKKIWENQDNWQGVEGCHFGVFRKDILKIGGFDETYEGHGFEDSDFFLRLIRSGIKRKTINQGSPVLHLYHPTRGGGVSPNAKRMKALITDKERIHPIKSLLL